MERIAIFAALRWECRPVLRQMRQVTRSRVDKFTAWRAVMGQREVWLAKTGIGVDQAAAAANAMADASEFSLFLSTGCAGALADALVPGDLTVATAVIDGASGDAFEVEAHQREHLRRVAERAGLRAVLGPVLCSARVLATVAQKQEAATRGCVAVEMESSPIATCALGRGIPFASVRAVLDTAGTELRHAGQFIAPESGAMKPLALAAYVATHPAAVSDLRAMQRMIRAAQHSLERFFSVWFRDQM